MLTCKCVNAFIASGCTDLSSDLDNFNPLTNKTDGRIDALKPASDEPIDNLRLSGPKSGENFLDGAVEALKIVGVWSNLIVKTNNILVKGSNSMAAK